MEEISDHPNFNKKKLSCKLLEDYFLSNTTQLDVDLFYNWRPIYY